MEKTRPDRFMQAVAIVGGAMLGYLALLDHVGHYLHQPWQRFPAMVAGALFIWTVYQGLAGDAHVSRAAQRAFWWGLWGLIGGYLLQVGYLWNRAGVLRPGAIGTTHWERFTKAIKHDDIEILTRMTGSWFGSETRWASLLLLAALIIGLVALARTGAWHLDALTRHDTDPDRGPRDIAFLQRQRWYLVWGGSLLLLITGLIGTDPRVLDFSEGLALSWAQQHAAIFGFIAGFIVESRSGGDGRRSRRRLRRWAAASVRVPGLPGRSALV